MRICCRYFIGSLLRILSCGLDTYRSINFKALLPVVVSDFRHDTDLHSYLIDEIDGGIALGSRRSTSERWIIRRACNPCGCRKFPRRFPLGGQRRLESTTMTSTAPLGPVIAIYACHRCRLAYPQIVNVHPTSLLNWDPSCSHRECSVPPLFGSRQSHAEPTLSCAAFRT